MDNIAEFPLERAARRTPPSDSESAQTILILPVIYRERDEGSTDASEKKSVPPARCSKTAVFANESAPPATREQPRLSDSRVAFESVRQAQFALYRAIEKLKRESDGSSKCIGDLLAILKTIEINLPSLAQ